MKADQILDALIEEALVDLFGPPSIPAWKAEQRQHTRLRRRRKPRKRQPVDIMAVRFYGVTDTEYRKVMEWARQGRISPALNVAFSVEATFYYQGSGRGLGVDREIIPYDIDFIACRLVVQQRDGIRAEGQPELCYELCGMAKCNRDDDEPDVNRGRLIALARALRGEAIPVKLGS